MFHVNASFLFLTGHSFTPQEGLTWCLLLQILRENPELHFRLRDQILIELIREGKLQEATEFAKGVARPIKENKVSLYTN